MHKKEREKRRKIQIRIGFEEQVGSCELEEDMHG